MSLSEELGALSTYLESMKGGVPYRLILAVGLAYFDRNKPFSDPLTSNLGFLIDFSYKLGAEKHRNGKSLSTVIVAFDSKFLEPIKIRKNSQEYTYTRLGYDIDMINNAIYESYEHRMGKIPGPSTPYPLYPKDNSSAYLLPYGNTLLCINKDLQTNYPERNLGLYSPFKDKALACVPSKGSDYEQLLHFCQKHSFEEVGIYNCAYVDERSVQKGSIRRNKYFENMCELLYIAYTCGKYSFLLDTTMGSVKHTNTRKVINRRRDGFYSRLIPNVVPKERQTSFLTVSPLNETTLFEQGYPLGTYYGGKRAIRKKRAVTRRWRK